MIAGFDNTYYDSQTIRDIATYLEEAYVYLPPMWANQLYDNGRERYGNFVHVEQGTKMSVTAMAIYNRYDIQVDSVAINYLNT